MKIRSTLTAAIVLAGTFLSVPAMAGNGGASANWVGTWSASPQTAGPFPADFAWGFENQTIRQIVHVSVGGSALRLRLTNAFGERGVRFESVYVGIQQEGAAIVAGSNRRLTFAGQTAVTLPPGASAISDPLWMAVPPLGNLVVSLFTAGPTGAPTMHLFANLFNFVSESGDAASDESGAPFTIPAFGCWYYLEGVDVLAPASVQGAVLALGDSLTDGLGSTPDANARYTDFLAGRFMDEPPGRRMAVLNEGMTGNRVLNDSPCFGVNAGARLDRDVLARRGVRAVIFTMGWNDFGFPVVDAEGSGIPECFQPQTEVSAKDVIAGYRNVIARLRAAGIRVVGATLTPIKGGFEWSPEGEAKRQALNAWIRGGEFDGVVDFAAAVADPADPESLAPEFDCGDHTHPNDGGYAAMAAAIDIGLFR